MNLIPFYITVISLVVGAHAQCPLINEFIPSTNKLEVRNYNKVPTNPNCILDVFITDLENVFFQHIPVLSPGEIYVIDLNINPGISTDEYLYVINDCQYSTL